MLQQLDCTAIGGALLGSWGISPLYFFTKRILCALCFVSFLLQFCLFLVNFSYFGIEQRRGILCSLIAVTVPGMARGVSCLNSQGRLAKMPLLTLFTDENIQTQRR